MPKSRIIFLFLIVPTIAGCATPYVRQWESQLWQVPNESAGATPEFGQFNAQDLDFGIICTEFRQVGNPNNRIIGIGVSCRNDAMEPMSLPLNPIQVVDASKVLAKPLSLNHVMYKFYGGGLREDAQIERLAETSKPLAAYGSSFLENVLIGVINAYREYEHGAIISEFHRKEALPYDLYYKGFTPTTLPTGVSTVWITYYPITTDTLTVMLHGGKIEEGIIFEQPPPPAQPKVNSEEREADLSGVWILHVTFVAFMIIIVMSTN